MSKGDSEYLPIGNNILYANVYTTHLMQSNSVDQSAKFKNKNVEVCT